MKMTKSSPKKGTIREYAEAIVVAVFIALILRAFVIEAFKIPSGSMIPTLKIGDHIFVNKFIYGLRIPYTNIRFFNFRTPHRGEVIVFIYPNDRSKDYIKRVVGVAGDTLEMKDGLLYVNNQPTEKLPQNAKSDRNVLYDFDEDSEVDLYKEKTGDVRHYTLQYKDEFNGFNADARNFGPITIPPNKLFVMGDNRDRSQDSRFWRFVPMENIKGKALVVWLSLDTHNEKSWFKVPMVRLQPEPGLRMEPLPRIRWERFGKLIR